MAKYRQITTVNEAAVLPFGSVLLLDGPGWAVTKARVSNMWPCPDNWWHCPNIEDPVDLNEYDMPARILYIPGDHDQDGEPMAQKIEEAIAKLVQEDDLGSEGVNWVRRKYGLA